jgi:flagellar biosynthesis/type III secretory pathway protein FliH
MMEHRLELQANLHWSSRCKKNQGMTLLEKRKEGRKDGRTGGREDGRTGGREDGRTGGREEGRKRVRKKVKKSNVRTRGWNLLSHVVQAIANLALLIPTSI